MSTGSPIHMFGVRLAVLGTVCAAILIGALLAIIPVSAQAASNGDLCLYGNDVSSDTGDQMAAGTSPAIAQLSGGRRPRDRSPATPRPGGTRVRASPGWPSGNARSTTNWP